MTQSSLALLNLVPSIALVSAMFIAAFSFLLPVAPTVFDPAMAHWRTAVAVMVFIPFVWAVAFFIKGLAVFKTDLKIAYGWLAVGMVLFGGSFVQLPLFGLFDLWSSAWATSGGVILPFILGTLFLYVGVRKFGRLLKLRGFLTSFLSVTGTTLAFTILSYFFALWWVQYVLEGVEVYIAAVGWTIAYSLFAGLLTYKISHVTGQYYRTAMKALSMAFFSITAGAIHEYITTFFMNNGHPYQDYGVYLWPFIISGMLFARAACEFVALDSKIKEEPAQKTEDIGMPDKNDYIDSIIAVAGLAARPDEVDPILDDLRVVTAHIDPNTRITQEQRTQLLDIYKRLESYFARSDRLRDYNTKEVRRMATPAMRHMLEHST